MQCLDRLIQNFKPRVPESLNQTHSLPGIVFDQLIDEVLNIWGELCRVRKLVKALFGIFEDILEQVIVKRQRISEPELLVSYIKKRTIPMAKLSMVKSKGSPLSTSGAI